MNELVPIHAKIIKKWHKTYDPEKKTWLSKPEKRCISALWQSKGNMQKAAKLLHIHEMLLLNYISKSKLYQHHLKMIRELQIDNIACEVFEGAEEGDVSKQMFVLERKSDWVKRTENNSNESKIIRIEVVKTIVNREERPIIEIKAEPEAIGINPEVDNAV